MLSLFFLLSLAARGVKSQSSRDKPTVTVKSKTSPVFLFIT
jgi:hypothetical protein